MKIVLAMLALCAVLVFWPSILKTAKQVEWNRNHEGSSQLQKPAMKVWVAKQVGFYYCPESMLYGKTRPGELMSQGRALEVGYRSATGEFCQ